VRPLLAQSGVNVNGLKAALDQQLDALARVEGGGGQLHVSNELNRLLNLTDKKAQKRGDQYIASEIFVLAALEEKKNPVAEALMANGANLSAVEKTIESIQSGPVTDQNARQD